MVDYEERTGLSPPTVYHYGTWDGIHTAREMRISTGPEPPVSTGWAPGTAWAVLNGSAFSTGQNIRY